MAITWTRAEIRAKVRQLASMPGTSNMSDVVINDKINDFYRNIFPGDVNVQELETFFTIDTAADDDGEYQLSDSMHTIEEPMTIKDSDGDISKVAFYLDKNIFFELYPEDSSDEDDERNTPVAALLYGRVVYLRPKADEVFTFKTAAKKKPAILSADGSTPLDVRWGPAIAYGTAILIREEVRDFDSVEKLSQVYGSLITIINRRDLIQTSKNQRAIPRF